jgi:glycosyltransferase involved in cell wall biosynthesis
MKILLVADLYPPLLGGTEHHVQTLARELIRRGHQVAVATMRPADAVRSEVDSFGVRIYRIGSGWAGRFRLAYPTGAPHHPPVADPGVARALRAIANRERPDVVYAHNWMLYSYLLAAQGQVEVPVMACLHDYWPICPARNLQSGGQSCRHDTLAATLRCATRQHGPAKGLAIGMGLWDARGRWHRQVSRFLAVSDYVADACAPALAGRPVFEAPTFVSADLVVTANNTPLPSFLPDRPYLLYVGGLGKHKGVAVLAEAYRLLGPDAPPLLILGTPAPGPAISWPTGVHVVHNVPHEQVMVAWKHALLGVVPSTWPEPFGQVAVEAMATGTPLIASDVGGLAALVKKHPAGELVPPGSPVALAACIRQTIVKPALFERAKAEAPRAAEQFFASQGVTVVEEHLVEVLHEHQVRA